MEVKLNREQIPNMLHFVSHLAQTMHSSKPGSLVIWWEFFISSFLTGLYQVQIGLYSSIIHWRYDSVTIEGHLDWQDQLNHKNKPFFDICDGIFVNYTWKVLAISCVFAGKHSKQLFCYSGRELSCEPCRRTIHGFQLLLQVIGSMMFTWVLMSLEGALMAVDSGM